MIPQRPTPPAYINPNDYTGDEIHWIEDQRDHEHAVAARAVRALREIAEFRNRPFGKWSCDEAADAIQEIEASGWKP